MVPDLTPDMLKAFREGGVTEYRHPDTGKVYVLLERDLFEDVASIQRGNGE